MDKRTKVFVIAAVLLASPIDLIPMNFVDDVFYAVVCIAAGIPIAWERLSNR